ncbi:MAG: PEP-CTERM sorting domain-containing protein [Leptospirillum sp.]
MNRMKKITITAGLALALTVGLGTTAKSAWAGYLAAPTLSPTTGSFGFTVANGANNNTPTASGYATAPSTFGNTIPTISALDSFAGATLTAPTLTDQTTGSNVFYSASGLDLQLVTSMTSAYSILNGTVTGNVISNVFSIGSGATMPGAVQGELVFTYQFDVTGASSGPLFNNNGGVSSATIGDFNNPNGVTYNLGSGVLTSIIGPSFSGDTYTNASGGQSLLSENSLQNTALNGKVTFAQNNSISSLEYALNTGSIDLGSYTPQFFVASNAFYTSMGTIGLGGSAGTDTVNVYVPGTPEPKTLILFGSGIALLAFMFRRKQENTLSI